MGNFKDDQPNGKVFSSKTRENKLKELGETESKFDFRIWVIIMEQLLRENQLFLRLLEVISPSFLNKSCLSVFITSNLPFKCSISLALSFLFLCLLSDSVFVGKEKLAFLFLNLEVAVCPYLNKV